MKKLLALLFSSVVLVGCAMDNTAKVKALTTDGMEGDIVVHYTGEYNEVKIKEYAIEMSQKNFGKTLVPESIQIVEIGSREVNRTN